MRARVIVLAVALVLAAAGVVALTGDSESPAGELPEVPGGERAFADAPPPLRGLYDERSRLLGGGRSAFERRIEQLRGYPVVVNKWASWCGPCRVEFPVFQKAAVQEAHRVAFLGVDTTDFEGDAREFLRTVPVPYPSYLDPQSEIARSLNAPQAFPATAFYDEDGELVYTRQGPYHSVDELLRDLRRYTAAGA